jgi:hypothetical protein
VLWGGKVRSFPLPDSICRRSRFWPAIALPEGFRIIAGESELTRYVFASQKNHHYFAAIAAYEFLG